jgi:hypothetical protein
MNNGPQPARKSAAKLAPAKPTVKRRSINQITGGSQQPGGGVPGHEQDVKRRLGNFTGKGEHARKGGRTSGIVGQTTKRNHTDRGSSKPGRPKKLGKGVR